MNKRGVYSENITPANYAAGTSGIQLAPISNPLPGVPVGLEHLASTDSIFVQQRLDFLEAFTGFERNNKYVVRNSSGQQIFNAIEDSDTFMRLCCGSQRRFLIRIFDNFNREALQITREFKCCAGCCWCAGCCDGCSHVVQVSTVDRKLLGSVKQKGSFCKPNFHILTPDGSPHMKINGPCCVLNGPCFPCANDFILSPIDSENELGKITKHYGGFFQEMTSNAQSFSISFPTDLAINVKATLMGALFLIDFMYYEQSKQNNSN